MLKINNSDTFSITLVTFCEIFRSTSKVKRIISISIFFQTLAKDSVGSLEFYPGKFIQSGVIQRTSKKRSPTPRIFLPRLKGIVSSIGPG